MLLHICQIIKICSKYEKLILHYYSNSNLIKIWKKTLTYRKRLNSVSAHNIYKPRTYVGCVYATRKWNSAMFHTWRRAIEVFILRPVGVTVWRQSAATKLKSQRGKCFSYFKFAFNKIYLPLVEQNLLNFVNLDRHDTCVWFYLWSFLLALIALSAERRSP